MFRNLARLIVLALLSATLHLATTSPADAARPTRPCKSEGMNNCIWDAKHMGNGVGRSYIVSKRGKVRYISHKRAHRLLYGKPKPKQVRLNMPKPTPPAPHVTPPPVADPAFPQGYGAMGDSIVFGSGSPDPSTQSWPAQAGITQNQGRPGACLLLKCWNGQASLLDDFDREWAIMGRPRAVVVGIGTNDQAWGLTVQQMVDGYIRLIKHGSNLNVRVVLATITPRSDGVDVRGDRVLPRIKAINDWIRTQRYHVDLDPCVATDQGTIRPEFDYGDGLHFNPTGNAAIAQCVAESIR